MCPPKPLRCKGWASARKNVCHRACRTCCMKCRRVPPGTYGNKPKCP
uniref:Gibberellin regulated protein n=1 Tax=Populus trichocarpa TaxID=3694 RepID=A0A2K1Y4D6_POPTR